MKKLLLFFFLTSFVYSQELPKFTPPSPTAYELGKYGEIPIGLFTGSPNIPVSLLEYKTKDLTIPISLRYSSNGIKVDQLETKVGLGWIINAGGIITRITKGGPDELRGYKHPAVINEDYRSLDFIDYYRSIIDGSKFDGSASLVYDSEPDIFNFNFLGRSGRFTFNNDGKIVLLSDFSLKVTFNPDGLGGFLLIDEQGVKYYFNEIEDSRLDTTGNDGSSHMGTFSTTSWSLSKIIMPNNDIINFNYADEVYNYVTTQEQSLRSLCVNYPILNTSEDFCRQPATPAYEGPLTNQNLNIKGKRIMSISSNNLMYGTVNFEYNIAHPQVANYDMLTAITLKNSLNSVVEKVDLSYITVAQRMFLDQVSLLDPSKKYNFEYVNLSGMPQRLSFSKDQWGYNNGINNNVKLYPNLSGVNNITENYFNQLFPNGANRNLDEAKAKTGLLQKVIYPTRGYSEFEYESNDYPTSENVSTMGTANLKVTTTPQDPTFAEKAATLTLTNLPESYTAHLKISFRQNYPLCNNYPYERKLFIVITNLTNPADTNMISVLGEPLGFSGNNIVITENDINMNKYIVQLTKNNSYSIKISVFYQCLIGSLEFDYPNSLPQLVFFNKKTGGLRVSKVTNKESSGVFLSSKKYFYARKDYLDMSSGTLPRPANYFSFSYDSGFCWKDQYLSNWMLTYYNLNFNDLAYKYLPDFQYTRYEYVTVSEDNDQFQNGGIEYKFKANTLPQMSPNAIVFGSFQEAFPDSWGDGLNLETTTFKKDLGAFKVLKKEIYDYQRDFRINEIIHGFKLEKKWDISFEGGVITPLVEAERELNVTKYDITTYWNYLSKKTVQNFDINGQNPIETVTNYFYDNPIHCQLSRTITNNSKGIPIITKTYYPDDVAATNSLGLETLSTDAFNAFNTLKTPTVSNPNSLHQNGIAIQTETYYDANNDGVASSTELLTAQRTNYKDWGNNNILPEKIQTLKGVYNSASNTLQDRIQYQSYYDDGKVKELSQKDGTHIVYIWGCNKTQPIAKIENAAYSEVSSYVANLQTLSDTGIEQNLIVALNTLRTSLPNAMVTTYTYKPLIGVSTITDPKGLTTYYEYDSFSRLQYIKDQDLNVLQSYCYNYKGQQISCTTDFLPAAPTGLTFNTAGPSQIIFSWAAVSGATGYKIYYNNGTYVTTVTAPTTSGSITGLAIGTIYDVQILASNASGDGVLCSPVSMSTMLAAPTNLNLTSATTSSINFSWTSVAGATGYKIFKNGDTAITTTATSGSFLGLTASTNYTIRVLAYNNWGDGLSSSVGMSTASIPTLLPAPTGLALTSNTTSSINFSWTAVAGATGYKIYKNGDPAIITNVTSGSFSGLTASTSYGIRVLAYNAVGDGSSTIVGMSTASISGLLPAPTGLTLTSNTTSSINFSWTAVAGATGYKIYKNGDPAIITNVTSGSFSGLTASTSYGIRVLAYNAAGDGLSTIVGMSTASISGLLPAPTGLTLTSNTTSSINFSWTAVAGAAGYKIFKNGDPAITTTATSGSFSGLTASTSYTIRVLAYNAAGDGLSSSAGMSTVSIQPPTIGFHITSGTYPATVGTSVNLTIVNTLTTPIYVYTSIQSLVGSGVGNGGGAINGISLPVSGTFTTSGQYFVSLNYVMIAPGATVTFSGGYGGVAGRLFLAYSLTPGGTLNYWYVPN